MKIAYFPLGDRNTASSRLRVHSIIDELQMCGHRIEVCWSREFTTRPDLVVVQKRQDMHNQMKWMVSNGLKVIFDIDDPTERLPPHTQLTVGSRMLFKQYRGSVYVPDCLDINDPHICKLAHNHNLGKVCWFGLSCNHYCTEPVVVACRELGLRLVVITDLNNLDPTLRFDEVEYIEWDRESVDSHIMACDVVVCPYVGGGRWSSDWINAKGENRLLKAWGLGLPVIGTPIPAYVEHELQYQASTVPEWIACLNQLRPLQSRLDDACRGRRTALSRVASRVALQWEKVFDAV